MEKILRTKQLFESQRNRSIFVVDPRNLDNELPTEMMLQAEQLRKLEIFDSKGSFGNS
ncbi:hypothetical protein DICPUDRAFT_92885 [Dictyostelium purpureum]|uniref:Uncharacterized protein n=1 Tax=Dictyostelium purpureum TaxID=5786 RepID=F0ZYP7_DICPU|nr:uncharacterized protein DICPUDRAFT_92885 [Dictyostelium purpureum]EGC30939.1 hypothetical protein DICPUDRAFT_92885 [Dictyostelium purpureum]|eukprot:XP_003292542.1 hypothetical protein DICPUDRAFT_92885 [Dictyostelium purpureum]